MVHAEDFPWVVFLAVFRENLVLLLRALKILQLCFLTRACMAPSSAGGNEAPFLRANWFYMPIVVFTVYEYPFITAHLFLICDGTFLFLCIHICSIQLMSKVSCWALLQLQLERLMCCIQSYKFTVQCRVFQRVLFIIVNAFYNRYLRTKFRKACNVASLNQPQAFYK